MSRLAPGGRGHGGATSARPAAQPLYTRLYDTLNHAGVVLELDVVPQPAAGVRRGASGYTTAGVCFIDLGHGRLTFTGDSIEEAAATAIAFGPDRARDGVCRAALAELRAQIALDTLPKG